MFFTPTACTTTDAGPVESMAVRWSRNSSSSAHRGEHIESLDCQHFPAKGVTGSFELCHSKVSQHFCVLDLLLLCVRSRLIKMAANLAKSADPLDMKNAVEIPLTDEATAAAEQKAQQQQQQKRQINWKFWEALNWEPLKTPRSVLKGGQVVSDNDL